LGTPEIIPCFPWLAPRAALASRLHEEIVVQGGAMKSTTWLIAVLLAGMAQVAMSAETAGAVAGLQPDRRPESAPVVAAAPLDDKEVARRLRGLEGAPPKELNWVAQEGPWYSPFGLPGMGGPYDWRRLREGAR
jgi:hypothetical protein